MPPAILDAANAHRAALLARDDATRRAMAARWLGVERSLSAATEALALQMANGEEPVTVEQLMRSRRYRELRQQLNAELRRYNAYADETITGGQRNMITDALSHSQAAIMTVAMEAQIVVPFNRLPVTAVERLAGLAGDGSPLASVLSDATAGAGDELAQRLVSGVALGQNPIEVARQAIRAGVGQSFTRIATIARSEMLRTYRLTTLEQYAASRVVISYTRISARDSRVCPACLLADGRTYPIDYGFDAHPQCLIGGTVVSSPTVLATSKRWFDGQVIEIRTVNGNVLTVTENHPILTDKGWIAAHLLKEGDNVISSLDSERTISLIDPNDYSRPAIIEDVIESFARTGGMVAVSVPTAPIDFHCDGMHGNVDIVRADSLLESSRQAALRQPTSEQAFVGSGMGLGLFPSDSAVTQLFKGALLAASCDMHRGGESGDFFRRALTHHEAVSFGLPANRDASFDKSVADNSAASALLGSDSILGQSREIHLDNGIRSQAHSFASHKGDAGDIEPPADSSAAGIVLGSKIGFGYAEPVQVDQFLNGNVDNIRGAFLPSLSGGNFALLGSAAQQAPSFQFSSKELLRGTPSLGGYVAAISSNIVADRILKVSRRHFSGHVYNLQTSTGWYIAEGIITHNCRCTTIPILRDVPPIRWQTGPEWLEAQPETTQRAILGKGRFEAWQSGRATLSDMVSRDWSDTWGGSLRPTRVRDLR